MKYQPSSIEEPNNPQSKKAKSKQLAYVMALRPRQWTKNLVVFAAPLFAFSINLQSFLGSLLAFILFCGASSGFYLINDIADVESDRQHPVKCQRPIAAGLVSVPVALGMALVLLTSVLTLGWLRSPQLGATVTAYALLQIAYNLRLKRMVILDIGAIATGFVLRAFAGAASTNIVLSTWFLLCTAMLALFLGIEKRKAELRLVQINGSKPRAVLRKYSLSLLSRMENVVTTGTVLTYTLWSAGPYLHGASTSWMLLTLPFVLYGIFRYQLLSDPQEIANDSNNHIEEGGRSERPEEVLLKDLPILVTVIGWILTCIAILYLKSQGFIM
ncbi:4-hydroxybenzoate polyprenyltransferase-like prenyltransferase [Cylindrospermum stagnale PCC 7417]|uniref:4-hydroxybenzoate polyprenyltransferase-like prenyltransferase n=1 Tax=Cylindrospermum stagnale PCC 7417 TaxID=56107 RepID=K9X407_9NOST|nr:decaprenyl-phosphate phosphoribosyltransferase [Cylindrospermum stagnale]AFZ26417.1 4-hydroxybenzoate polyprenyltransferase-like prenyltransferase [Cylindrospermum stagnale PCC 7417]